MQNVENKVVVITGASSGMGREVARHLVKAGAKVILGARRLERLHELADELGISHEHCLATDVTKAADVQALVNQAVKLYGRLDVMLNNAGVMPLSNLEELKIDEWNSMIDINLRGLLHSIGAALPIFKEQKFGQFVTTASLAAHIVGPSMAVYSATKYAARIVMEGLRQEVKPYNIRTTTLCPGSVATELGNSISNPELKAWVDGFTKEHAMRADSYARCVLFAISQPENVDINEIIFRPTSQAM
ncbi:SDR family oxidoreductase [Basfia succiniciproducens]|uniref:SDR family oxidoreductase n=1 Tax=Basfia succiniciproducens TaxID=653940 RepID=UPI003FCD8884